MSKNVSTHATKSLVQEFVRKKSEGSMSEVACKGQNNRDEKPFYGLKKFRGNKCKGETRPIDEATTFGKLLALLPSARVVDGHVVMNQYDRSVFENSPLVSKHYVDRLTR